MKRIKKFTVGNPYKDASLGVFKWGRLHYARRFTCLLLLLILCVSIDISNKEFFASSYSLLVTILLTVQYLHTYYKYYDLAAKWDSNYGKIK